MKNAVNQQLLISDLGNANWVTRSEALQTFTGLQDVKQVQALVQEILTTKNNNALLYLLREIGQFEVEVAVSIMGSVMKLETPPFTKEIIDSIQKLPEKFRIELCLEGLKRHIQNHTFLASLVTVLGNTRTNREVFPLLDVMTASKSEEVLTACLEAFRKIKDVRVVSPFIGFAKGRDFPESVLPLLIIVLGELSIHFSISHKFFLNFLGHTNNKVRQAVIWSLAQYNRPKLFKNMIKHYRKENSGVVRTEILKHLSNFPVRYNTEFLFEVLMQTSHGEEKLLAESAMESIPPEEKQQMFREKIKSEDPIHRTLASRYLAKLNDHDDIPLLLELLRKDPEVNVRSQTAELLGGYDDENIYMELFKCLQEDREVAYSATLALCKSTFVDKQDLFIHILRQNKKEDVFIYQTILSYLPRYFKIFKPQFGVHSVLVQKLEDENVNIRFLAAQALGETAEKSSVLPLVKFMQKETIPSLLSACFKAVYKLLNNDKKYLTNLLSQEPGLLLTVTELIAGLELPSQEKSQEFIALLNLSVQKGMFDDFIHSLDSLKNQEPDVKLYIMAILDSNLEDANAVKILKYLVSHNTVGLDSYTSEFVVKLYKSSSAEVCKYLCPLLSRTTGAVKQIAQLYLSEEDKEVKKLLHEVLLTLSKEI
ncbi:MAG: HEAT repeat domain-containing protein [Fibrobacteria bacterium]|nr:HEAT repeat domain-containing protein [Fibrobacteria bacterium]